MQLSLNKLNQNILEITKSFEDHLRKIQDQNYTNSNINLKDDYQENDNLQQQLLQKDFIDNEQIHDQRDLVNERQKNIEDLSQALSEIKNMTQEMKTVTQMGGEKLNNINMQQEKHLNNLNNKINVDLTTTEQYQGSMIQRICWWGLLILLVLVCVLLIIYFLK